MNFEHEIGRIVDPTTKMGRRGKSIRIGGWSLWLSVGYQAPREKWLCNRPARIRLLDADPRRITRFACAYGRISTDDCAVPLDAVRGSGDCRVVRGLWQARNDLRWFCWPPSQRCCWIYQPHATSRQALDSAGFLALGISSTLSSAGVALHG